MENEEILIIIKVVSAVLTIFFGIVATLTETKNKETNKLTKWGKVAIVGIVLLGSFIVIEIIINKIVGDTKNRIALTDKLEEEERVRNEALQAAKQYYENAKRQNDNIKLTRKALNRLDTTLDNQLQLLSKNQILSNRQSISLNNQIGLQEDQQLMLNVQNQVYSKIKESQYSLNNLQLTAQISYDIDPNFSEKVIKMCQADWGNKLQRGNQNTNIDSLGIHYRIYKSTDNEPYIGEIDFDASSPLLKDVFNKEKYNEFHTVLGFRNREIIGYPTIHVDSLNFTMEFSAYNEKGNYKSINEINKDGQSSLQVSLRLPPPNMDSDGIDYYNPKPNKLVLFIRTSRVDTKWKANHSFLNLYDLADKHILLQVIGDYSDLDNLDIEWLSLEVGSLYHRTIVFKSRQIEKRFGEQGSDYYSPGTFYYFLKSDDLDLEPLKSVKNKS